jgi:C1A family cysteine protease
MSTPVTPRKTARYGWTPDLPDARDHLFSAPQISLVALPPSADLRGTCPPVYDQAQIGSCTANAIGAAFEFETTKQGLPGWGQAGYFTMPYAYLTTRGLSSDFWTIRIVT